MAIFLSQQYGSNSNHCDAVAPKATEFREITQNNDHYAFLGYSRSPISVPWSRWKALYGLPMYQSITVTYLASCTVSEIWRITGPIFALNRGLPLLNARVEVNP